MADKREWDGTPTEHYDALTRQTSDSTVRSRSWPKTPQHLTTRLKRQAPALRGQGLVYEDYTEGDRVKTRMRRVSWEDGHGPTEEEIREAQEAKKRESFTLPGTPSEKGGTPY
jgi:hypothetical protein